MRKELQALQADRAKLEGEVGQLKEEHKNAVDNWKNWAKKRSLLSSRPQWHRRPFIKMKSFSSRLKMRVFKQDKNPIVSVPKPSDFYKRKSVVRIFC